MNILNIIFRTVRDYSTAIYTLPQVVRQVVLDLKDYGYDAAVEPGRSRNDRTVAVDGHHYSILRRRDWLRYDVIMID